MATGEDRSTGRVTILGWNGFRGRWNPLKHEREHAAGPILVNTRSDRHLKPVWSYGPTSWLTVFGPLCLLPFMPCNVYAEWMVVIKPPSLLERTNLC